MDYARDGLKRAEWRESLLAALDDGGETLALVPRALLLQALAALERQPRRDPNDWWPGDAADRSKAKRALRKALGVQP